ncbi:Bug family tripartite tricarboxylate transporter substrate binding protein [Xylophilus sp.]|uniref:Bug family tripartite tricarboxylate transporter substrate binding protein n=1 Tax=Xylophilus sp. TaxID=2653893 RepID=UPI0013B933A6|nr:tripartite tricarboxylate transporter substrate binding protein [Xylophilus sp.]KAF1050185.1 MAG: hypothetical protein GAK38_00211 [Xylophilus sp.]
MYRSTFIRLLPAFAAAFWGATGAAAPAKDDLSAKPVTWVVPFAAGGTSDILARVIGQKLGPALDTTVVVENRPGAGGNIGSAFVANAKPDGHTLVGGTISSHAINVSLYPSMPYDPVRSFEPITLIGTLPNVLVVKASFPYRTVKDVVDAAKARPGKLTFGSSGSGTSQHLSGELFKSIAQVDMTHVPYKGGTGATTDLLAGNIDLNFENIVVVAPLIKSGQLRALGVPSAQRSRLMPDVPSLAEAGLAGYEIVSWQAVFAPAGTPAPIVQRLSTQIGRILAEPEVKQRLFDLGMEPSGMKPAELRAYQHAEVEKWAALIKARNIRMD